jgi:hypothetical protein
MNSIKTEIKRKENQIKSLKQRLINKKEEDRVLERLKKIRSSNKSRVSKKKTSSTKTSISKTISQNPLLKGVVTTGVTIAGLIALYKLYNYLNPNVNPSGIPNTTQNVNKDGTP